MVQLLCLVVLPKNNKRQIANKKRKPPRLISYLEIQKGRKSPRREQRNEKEQINWHRVRLAASIRIVKSAQLWYGQVLVNRGYRKFGQTKKKQYVR
jgi:hypothetical protein